MEKLTWLEYDLFTPNEYTVASSVYENLNEEHKQYFKRFVAHIDFEIDEKDIFKNQQMWGFPKTNVTIFHFSIAPRYNTEKFLELEYPFMSVHRFLNSPTNNHVYLKTVKEGKEYAEELYNVVFNRLTTQLHHR